VNEEQNKHVYIHTIPHNSLANRALGVNGPIQFETAVMLPVDNPVCHPPACYDGVDEIHSGRSSHRRSPPRQVHRAEGCRRAITTPLHTGSKSPPTIRQGVTGRNAHLHDAVELCVPQRILLSEARTACKGHKREHAQCHASYPKDRAAPT
jgi:hypothetical protein